LIATKKITGKFYPVRVKIGIDQILIVNIARKPKIIMTGNLVVNSWGGCNIASSITISNDSHLIIEGDFEIGPNVHITLGPCAVLKLGGKKNSSASGITGNSRIMVEKSITIGRDCIIAWDVFITDSNFHNISGVIRSSPVSIGDRVWISHGVSVLKGAVIPSGCIVAAKSLVRGVFEFERALIAGVPAKLLRNDVEWSR
jgi:acetyltransferase-like isoleucine patch superfamily enzyme